MGLVALISQVLPMDDSVPAIILLIGLAVGVDYTMFYLKREREERAAGRSEEAALEAAAATSGRSVLISGSTVLVAMAGMFLTGDAGFASFGVATMTVVAVAMLGSLTVLPALLSKLGDGVDRVRVPFVHRLRRNDGEGRDLGSDHRPRPPATRSLSVALAGGLLSPSRCRRSSCTRPRPSIDTLSAEVPDELQPRQGGIPRHRDRGERRDQGARTSKRRRSRTRSASSSGARWPPVS